MIWRKYRSIKNDPALSIVGADLCVCPGLGMRRGAGADTQVCPYGKRPKIFVSLLSRAMILLLLIGSQIFLLATVFLLAASAVAQDPPPNAKWRLTKINFEGLKSQSPEKMIPASGLQIGQTIDFEAVKAAAQRLSQTGLFGKVAYRYRYSSTQIELTFELEEKTTGKKRCHFDNFVWFSDKEIADAIRLDMPDFDGTIPVSDFAGEEIKKSLGRLLAEKKIAGEIVYELYREEDKPGEDLSYIFKVKGANLSICDINFAGANDELKKPLLEALQPLFKTEYSKSEVWLFVKAALLPIYRQRGYLKAAFKQNQPGLSASGACANAVVVTLPVEEGLQYRWSDPVWSGNQACSAQDLNASLTLKQDDVADLMKIEKGWIEVRGVYGKKGFLKPRLKPEPQFDDARKLVGYQVAVAEGPQYRMGQVTITGLPEDEAARIKSAWGLKTGEVFDNSYFTVFLNKIAREGLIKPAKGMKTGRELKLDDQKLIVDVLVKFERQGP
jgi:outer membrane protein assembly factor BamA